ncbi:MAG: hypothetical protein QOJ06_1481, partial [Pseudonocardiales bacterium]|nr:hypothetical protein [Pseudonocardiales bacterium]
QLQRHGEPPPGLLEALSWMEGAEMARCMRHPCGVWERVVALV